MCTKFAEIHPVLYVQANMLLNYVYNSNLTLFYYCCKRITSFPIIVIAYVLGGAAFSTQVVVIEVLRRLQQLFKPQSLDKNSMQQTEKVEPWEKNIPLVWFLVAVTMVLMGQIAWRAVHWGLHCVVELVHMAIAQVF